METRAVTSPIAYVPELVEAEVAAAAGARAQQANASGVASAGAGRVKGGGAAMATRASGPAKARSKTAAASRPKVVPSGPGQVAVPSKGYATTAPAKSAKTTTASSSKAKTTTTAKATGDYAFLQDASLSAQEKLLLFLAVQKKNANKELETMLDKAAAQKEAAAKKKSGGGLFGGVTKLFDVAKAVVPALGLTDQLLGGKLDDLLKQVSGPMLGAAATALGMPALAPLAMSMGPKLVAAVMDAELPGAEKTTAAASSSSTNGKKGGELDEVELARVQMLQKRVEEWTALISNLMQSFHQTRMSVVQNLR